MFYQPIEDEIMKEIIGKKIDKIEVDAGDQETLVFTVGDEKLIYQGYGDCCSETWFADITGVSALIGGTVTSVETVQMAEVEDGRTRQEHDEIYGYKIKTDKGYADIAYRNSSNGYYGGSCDYIPGLDVSQHKFIEITDDWAA